MKQHLKPIIIAAAILASYGVHAQGDVKATPPATRQRPPVKLKVGDPAPPLVAAKWIKGTPVAEFEQGKVYVVEFWATWCGPCRANMPHLSELARRYKGKATVLSFDVQELIAAKDKNGDYI